MQIDNLFKLDFCIIDLFSINYLFRNLFSSGSFGRDHVRGQAILDRQTIDGSLDLSALNHAINGLGRVQLGKSHLDFDLLILVFTSRSD